MAGNTRHIKSNTGSRIATGALIVLISLLCFLSSVGALGGVGRMIYSFFIGFFGLAGYAYALSGIIFGLALVFNIRKRITVKLIAYLCGLFAIGLLALQIYTSSVHIVESNYGAYLLNCYNHTNTAGGMLFGVLAFPLMKFITPVGALALICVIFFAVASLALIPFFKRNTVMSDASSKRRVIGGFSFKKNKNGMAIRRQKSPSLTNFGGLSYGRGNLIELDVEGEDTLKAGKRSKGADGYNPLYPNAQGNIEDEEKTYPAATEKFTPQSYARDFLFSSGGDEDVLTHYRAAKRPEEALGDISAPYSAIKRSELRNKLGLDNADATDIKAYTEKYNLSDSSVGEIAKTQTEPAAANDGIDLRDSLRGLFSNDKYPVNTDNQSETQQGKDKSFTLGDFSTLKEEQARNFAAMFSDKTPVMEAQAYSKPEDESSVVKGELEKKEVPKTSRFIRKPEAVYGDSINSTVDKAQAAVSGGNLSGIHGAVTRALSGEDPDTNKRTTEISSDAYEVSGVKNYPEKTQTNLSDVSQKPEEQTQNKIPRAFEGTSIYKTDENNRAETGANRNAASYGENSEIASRLSAYKNVEHYDNGGVNNSFKYQNPQSDLGAGNTEFNQKRNVFDRELQNSVRDGFAGNGYQPPVKLDDIGKNGEIIDRNAVRTLAEGVASMKDADSIPSVLPEKGETFEHAQMRAKLEELKQKRQERVGWNNVDNKSNLSDLDKLKAVRGQSESGRTVSSYPEAAKQDTPVNALLKNINRPNDTAAQTKKSEEKFIQVSIDQAISQVTPRIPYVAPSIKLLNPPVPTIKQNDDREIELRKDAIIKKLEFFGVDSEVMDVKTGPTFSLFELKVDMPKGKKINTLETYDKDIAMCLEEESVRILAPIPGKNAVGIEVPNKKRSLVTISEVLTSPVFNQAKSPLTFVLGKDLYGENFICDIKSLPHMLIAGTTGAGKSCCINSIIISLLYKASPEDVRLILIDPKRVELSIYAGIPHLLMDEIICDVDKAIRALSWCVSEMTRRTKVFENRYRDIDDYNADCENMGYEKMPRIVVIIDELADLMSVGGKPVEDSINRIARLARAVGIHLILATQRPSVDVISGTIKNNIPTRVAFKVTSYFDSRTVLDTDGADKLLGNGDMLFMTPKSTVLKRMQGAFISTSEVQAVVDFVKQYNTGQFDKSVKEAIFSDNADEKNSSKDGDKTDKSDKDDKNSGGIPADALAALPLLVIHGKNFSISLIQRRLGYGWPRASRAYDVIIDMGFATLDEKSKISSVNITMEEVDKLVEGNRGDEA